MKAAILGKKLGMTSYFTDDGIQIPCTVIEAGPCTVVQVKTNEKEGYNAIQIGFEEIAEKKVNNPLKGHFEKAGVKPTRYLKEFRDFNADLSIGEVLSVKQFETGDKVKITSKSKGRGFQGVVKRHHFGGGKASHGQSSKKRHGGSVGASSYPSRIFKGKKMPGQMSGKKASIQNIEIIEVLPEQNLILIKGSVPGAPNTILEIIKR
ncbi:MAG: 50S ribosomal protein L3 [Ignavibacteria bacterium]|nr:50S ribosomal protein L3 [Ignavibacteria bacterium]